MSALSSSNMSTDFAVKKLENVLEVATRASGAIQEMSEKGSTGNFPDI